MASGHEYATQFAPSFSKMDASSRERVSIVERAGIILAGLSIDMAINYPMWISAKRVSAGLTMPRLGEVYKGSGSLMFAMGPMIVVQDATTAVVLRSLDGKLDPTAAQAASACVAGAVGALTVGAQIEAVITRSHAIQQTITQTTWTTFRTSGIVALVAPYGAMMIAAREVPYAGCLFFLSGWIRARLDSAWPPTVTGSGGGSSSSSSAGAGGSGGRSRSSILRDIAAAALTASIAGPISQAPSVIAAHQQAHAVSFGVACQHILAKSGPRGFYGGLLLRTTSLAGSMFVFPFSIETAQPLYERWRRKRTDLERPSRG